MTLQEDPCGQEPSRPRLYLVPPLPDEERDLSPTVKIPSSVAGDWWERDLAGVIEGDLNPFADIPDSGGPMRFSLNELGMIIDQCDDDAATAEEQSLRRDYRLVATLCRRALQKAYDES